MNLAGNTKKIKILYVISKLWFGGAQRMLYNLIKNHDKGEFEISVLVFKDEGIFLDKIKALGITVYCLNAERKNVFRCAWQYLNILKVYQPDIVSTWMLESSLYAGVLTTIFYKKAKLIWNIRGTRLLWKGDLKAIVIRYGTIFFSYFSPDFITYDSNEGKRYYESIGFKDKKSKVIHNGINPNILNMNNDLGNQVLSFKKDYKVSSNKIVIGTIGRWDPMKDYETFIKSARIIKERSKIPVQFLICGHRLNIENKELIKIIGNNNLLDDFVLAGPQEVILHILKTIDIYISCSKSSEGTSNAILEAMGMELPCIVTNVGDAAYMVDNVSLVAPPQAPEAIAQKCLDLIEAGKEERESIGKQLKQRIEDHFLIQHTISKFEAAYKKLVE